MVRVNSNLRTHAAALLGAEVPSATPVSGGDICLAYRLELADGSVAFLKTLDDASPDFFPTEADGLTWLAAAGGAPTPSVLAVDERCLILEWVDAGPPSPAAAEHFGRELAQTHLAGAEQFGSAHPGYAGALSMPGGQSADWPEFYATARIEPALRAAVDTGSLATADRSAVTEMLERLPELAGPAEPPARLHGDLWAGNVLWTTGGRCHLIDPAAHGGHRETDLAMLDLFGLSYLEQVIDAYQQVNPLADGWQARIALHQLHPLLVHTALFGGGYGRQAGSAARAAVTASGPHT